MIVHTLDPINCTDWAIDHWHKGENKGSKIRDIGTQKELAKCSTSNSGRCLKHVIDQLHQRHWQFDDNIGEAGEILGTAWRSKTDNKDRGGPEEMNFMQDLHRQAERSWDSWGNTTLEQLH